MNAERKNNLLDELYDLTKSMDVPEFRRSKPRWLLRNVGIRNSDHKNYERVVEISKELVKLGVN